MQGNVTGLFQPFRAVFFLKCQQPQNCTISQFRMGVLPSAWIQPPGLWTGPYVFPARSGVPVSMSRAAGGALACEADWLCVYIHVCCADVAPHTAPCARAVPPTAPPSVTDADRPVRVERSTSDGHIQRGSQGQPSQLCIPCIHKVPEAAERVLAHPVCGSVLHGFDCRTPFIDSVIHVCQ